MAAALTLRNVRFPKKGDAMKTLLVLLMLAVPAVSLGQDTAGVLIITKDMMAHEDNESFTRGTPVDSTRDYTYDIHWRMRGAKAWNDLPGLQEEDLPLALDDYDGIVASRHYIVRVRYAEVNGPGAGSLRLLVASVADPVVLLNDPPQVIVDQVDGHTTLQGFLEGLPSYQKDFVTFMHESGALNGAFVDEYHPRVISFGTNGDMLLSWITDEEAPRYDIVEYIVPAYDEWEFGTIDFSDPAAVEVKRIVDDECSVCHGDHPLWPQYTRWPGALDRNTLSTHRYGQLADRYYRSDDPRLSILGGWRVDYPARWEPLGEEPKELTRSILYKHAEILFNRRMELDGEDFDRTVREFICTSAQYGPNAFYQDADDPAIFAFGSYIDPDNTGNYPGTYTAGNGSLNAALRLLVHDYLYRTYPEVRADMESMGPNDLVFAPERSYTYLPNGTFGDEIKARMRLAFELEGEEHYSVRGAARGRIGKKFTYPFRYGYGPLCNNTLQHP